MAKDESELGWIKLHRKLLKSQIWCNPNGLKVWLWILLKVNYSDKPNWVAISTGKGNTSIRVFQGQFIYGRKAAAEELKMNASTVDYWIRKLASTEYDCMIVRQPKTHFTIIQVNNWSDYQETPDNNQITTKYQPNNTNKKYKKYKKGKKTLSTKDSSPRGERADTILSADAESSISVPAEADNYTAKAVLKDKIKIDMSYSPLAKAINIQDSFIEFDPGPDDLNL